MTAPSSSGATGLVLTGATMELTGTRGPATLVTDVTLVIGPDGFTVTPPAAGPTSVSWAAVGWAHCGEGGLMADGAPAVAVAATVGGHLVRWLVSQDQMPPARALAIDQLLTARTAPPMVGEPEPVTGPVATAGSNGTTGTAPTSPVRAPVPHLAPPPVPQPPGAPAPRLAPPPVPRLAPRPLPHSVRRRNRGHPRPLGVMVAWLAIVALVLVGAGLLVASSIHVPPHPGHRTRSPTSQQTMEARTLARAVSLRLADLPAGWTVVRTPSGPLSGFIGSGTSVTSAPPDSTQASNSYRRCLGVRTAAVPLVSVGPAPLAKATSGAFAGPATGAPMQVASITAVYATATPVRRAVDQLGSRRFATCFGAAVGTGLARSLAARAPSGVTTGTASTDALPLPRWAGIRATGVDLKLPLDVRGDATSVQLGFVFVTGARVESTLVSFSTSGVPESVSRALAATLEEEVAAAVAA